MAEKKKSKREKGGGEGGVEMETSGMSRWLLTYADMLTLLFALFIILYSMSMANPVKAEAAALALRKTFGVLSGGEALLSGSGSHDNTDYNFIDPAGSKSGMRGLQLRLKRTLRGYKGKVVLQEDERGLIVHIMSDGLLFLRGDADFLAGAKEILAAIIPALREVSSPILVEGHTCDLPIQTAAFPSNWELSAARATNVVKYLVEDQGFSPARISAAGYGEFRPLWPNTSDENRELNRRVDIVILKEGGARSPAAPLRKS